MKEFEFIFQFSTFNSLKKLQREIGEYFGEEISLTETVYSMMTITEYWLQEKKREQKELNERMNTLKKRQKNKQ